MGLLEIGHIDGYKFATDGHDIYRCDIGNDARMGMRWFSTVSGFDSFLRAYGPLKEAKGKGGGDGIH